MKACVVVVLALCCIMPATRVARADAQQDQSACINDAQTYCGQFIPDRLRVARCLMTNRRHIAPACREALKRFK